MKTYLKVKIASLAAEAIIIKREEQKWKEVPFLIDNLHVTHPLYFGLRAHRVEVVRRECRASNIAYGYLRGRAYKQIENKCHEAPNWERVADIIRTFGKGYYSSPEARKKLAEDLKAWAATEPVSVAA